MLEWPKIFVVALLAPVALADGGGVLQVHGSGTTNPSKCLWMLMDQFMERSLRPIRMTYRAVGSSTGHKEFLGVNKTTPFSYENYNDFAAADIPLSSDEYNALNAAGHQMVTLPFVLGSVGVFLYNLLDEDDASVQANVNLTGCNLAKIFKREIIHWDDPEILQDNPKLKEMLPYERVSIHVARRVHGSSSTASLTTYLNLVCPDVWPEEMVGKVIDWPEDTMKCEGSAGMTECVKNTPGAIGYMESGHGWSENLVEVELQNKAGTFLTSRLAAENGGIGGAAGDVPGSADADFGHVNLLNKDGDMTWPITLMSYIFVRKDLSFIDSPQEQTLLVAFLRSLYDADNINQCSMFGFSPVPGNVREVALEGIDMLNVAEGATEWIIETKTMPGIGQGDYVISSKRRTFSEYLVSSHDDDIAEISDSVDALNNAVTSTSKIQQQASTAKASSSATPTTFTTDDAQKIQAALVMSVVSIVLWGVAAVGLIVKRVCGL